MTSHSDLRVATLCIEGVPAQSVRENGSRIDLLEVALDKIDERARDQARWRGLDAIVLPGGSFRLRHNTGCADLSVRAAALAEAGLVAPLRNAATKLSRSPSVAIIAGADGPDSDKTRAAGAPGGGDQLCVAWNSAGVAAVGRKVFPTWDAYPKTGDYEGDRLTCCAEDYGTKERVVELAGGRSALLCACYDMFAVADCAAESWTRAAKVQHVMESGKVHHRNASSRGDQAAFDTVLDACIARWRNLIRRTPIDAAFAAIHGFEGPSTSFWQRHGIAGASAAMRGGLAIGAAHFLTLPSAPGKSTLAAKNVSVRHAAQGTARMAHTLEPVDAIYIEAARTIPAALVRLFV